MPEDIKTMDGSTLLTEVALALAMAFFCLLVLALVSFSAERPSLSLQTITFEPSSHESGRPVDRDDLLFMHNETYVNAGGQAVDPAQLEPGRGVVLVVPDTLSAADLAKRRASIAHPDLTVTVITPEWQDWLSRLTTSKGGLP